MSNLNHITITQKDQKTGTNHFKLRDYDARLARWTIIDPYNQYHSPYLAMGNNPISKIDPDGGMATGGGYKINETADYFINKQNRMNKEMRGFGMYEDGSGLHGGGGGVSGASGYNIDGLNVSASIGNRMLKNNSFLKTVDSYNGLMLRGSENLSHTNGKLFINSYSFITVIEPNNFGGQLIGYQFSIGSVNFYKEVVTTSFEVGSVGGAQGSGGTDLTSQFNQRIGAMEATFGAVGNTMNALYGGPILSYPAKMAAFGYMQYKGAKTEFMNPKAFPKSVFTKNGGGFVNGQYFSPDDFGNYFYGVAARSMGLSSIDAVQGAGIYAISSGSVTDWTNFYGFFDERKDTRMILRGYYGK